MAAFDLTSRPFEGMVRDHFQSEIKRLAKLADTTNKNTCLELLTHSKGELCLIFRPKGKVEVNWRDRGGIKEGWFTHNWSVKTLLRNWNKLMAN